MVNLRSVVLTPALALEADTIVDQHDAAAVHSLDHRLGDAASGTDGADSGDRLKELGKVERRPLLERCRLHSHCLLEVGRVLESTLYD